MRPTFYLTDFRSLAPPYRVSQERALDWIARSHAKAGQDIEAALEKYGARPPAVQSRSSYLEDFTHTDWSRAEVFRLDERPTGLGWDARNRVYERAADQAFRELYAGHVEPLDEIIHVTCTGYLSPSAAQLHLTRTGSPARVTHAYHMGCYASIPAIRMAAGALSTPEGVLGTERTGRVDVVHTELCSLHLNPAAHDPEQLVVQSLFADGVIRYRVQDVKPGAPALEVLALREERAPGSERDMEWIPADWGMRMTLSRAVPLKLSRALKPFLARLAAQAGLSAESLLREAVFAVHPGGPKIVDHVQSMLELGDAQVLHSREVLRDRGNMSSATLPHIWERLLAGRPAAGTLVVSFAFGPGLTLCGGVFRVA